MRESEFWEDHRRGMEDPEYAEAYRASVVELNACWKQSSFGDDFCGVHPSEDWPCPYAGNPDRWTCQLHDTTGAVGDGSHKRHLDAHPDDHGGVLDWTVWWTEHDCGFAEGSFACRIRHISLQTGWARKDHR